MSNITISKNKFDNEGPVTGLMSDPNGFWLRKIAQNENVMSEVGRSSRFKGIYSTQCAADNLNSCHKWATSSNIPGSYQCVFNIGFTGVGFEHVDNDELTNGDNNCHITDATCTNNNGSFTCACNAGYSGEVCDDDCTDIDECATDTNECHDVATYTNTIGSYK